MTSFPTRPRTYEAFEVLSDLPQIALSAFPLFLFINDVRSFSHSNFSYMLVSLTFVCRSIDTFVLTFVWNIHETRRRVTDWSVDLSLENFAAME